MTVDDMIEEVIRREGGLADHPADRGGITNFGITQATLAAYLARPATSQDVRNLDQRTAHAIYKEIYYRDPQIDRLPEPWRPIVFDWGVNSGPATAIRELQRLCQNHGADPGSIDGVIGPRTIAAATKLLTVPMRWYLERRRDFYRRIVADNPTQAAFLNGWMARVDGLERGLG